MSVHFLVYDKDGGQVCSWCWEKPVKKDDWCSKTCENAENFVIRSTEVHEGKYDYSKVEYKNSKKKVTIICPKHGEFQQLPNGHLNKQHGCRTCRHAEEFVQKSTVVHNGWYDYSKVKYVHSEQRVVIICPEHGEFTQKPSHHLQRKHGCTRCGVDQRDYSNHRGPRLTQEQFLENVKAVHGNRYDYSLAKYIDGNTPVTIICKEHGTFEQKPCNHIHGSGCTKCGAIQKSKSLRLTQEQFLERAKAAHGNKYDYSLSNYVDVNTYIIVLCPKHGEFKQAPYKHIYDKKHGCRKCADEYRQILLRLTQEQFLERARAAHGDRYDYSLAEYVDKDTPVTIICKEHGPFEQRPGSHVYGKKSGCIKCAKIGYSKVAIEWMESIMDENNIYIQHAENNGEHILDNTKIRVDGYCHETNTVYEFHGDYWHGHPKYPRSKFHTHRKI